MKEGLISIGGRNFRLPLVLGQGSPIIHSSCEGELGVALESLSRPPALIQELRILGQRPHLRGPQSLERLVKRERSRSRWAGLRNLHFKQCCLRVVPRRGPRSSRSGDKALPLGAAGSGEEVPGGVLKPPTLSPPGEIPGTRPALLCSRVRGGREAQALAGHLECAGWTRC